MTSCVQPIGFYKNKNMLPKTTNIRWVNVCSNLIQKTTHLFSFFDCFYDFFSIDDDLSIRASSNTFNQKKIHTLSRRIKQIVWTVGLSDLCLRPSPPSLWILPSITNHSSCKCKLFHLHSRNHVISFLVFVDHTLYVYY